MRPIDAQQKIKELATGLDVQAFLAKMREYERAGLPSQSMSDGRGGDSPCPVATTPQTDDWLPNRGMPKGRVLGVADPTDREIRADRLLVEQGLRHAAVALVEVVQVINAWTVPRTDDTQKAEKLKDEKPGRPCSNLWCDHVCTGIQNDRLRDGRCPTCAQYWRRNGVERDPRPREDVAQPGYRGDAA